MEELKTVTFTLAEFADAIEKNGLQQTYSTFFRGIDGRSLPLNTSTPIAKACAMGMGAINLELDITDLRYKLKVYEDKDTLDSYINIGHIIENWNDDNRLDFSEIADMIRKTYPTMLDRKFVVQHQQYSIDSMKNV